MFSAGLVSVTFRKLSPYKIVTLAKQAHLSGIEWGGDLHVPHGDLCKAREVYQMTTDEGLSVAAYGSYYRVGCHPNPFAEFEKVLETAVELQAPTIRVWAGNKASRDADPHWWETIINQSRTIADLAERAGVSISYEYHRNTLTDTNETAVRLLQSTAHRNIHTYWQPLAELSFEAKVDGLLQIKSKLSHLHVFHWLAGKRAPLNEGVNDWKKYFEICSDGHRRYYALLEFVVNDDEIQFLRDAEILHQLLDGC